MSIYGRGATWPYSDDRTTYEVTLYLCYADGRNALFLSQYLRRGLTSSGGGSFTRGNINGTYINLRNESDGQLGGVNTSISWDFVNRKATCNGIEYPLTWKWEPGMYVMLHAYAQNARVNVDGNSVYMYVGVETNAYARN